MRLVYCKPRLKDLSQGSRIAFARQFRLMSQDDVSDMLGLTGECKRRTMTRYEKGNRNPKDDRIKDIANILKVNYNALKRYDYKNSIDIIYTLLWLEELIPNYEIDFSNVPSLFNKNNTDIKNFINEWNKVRLKRKRKNITYEEYIEWKLTYEKEVSSYENDC